MSQNTNNSSCSLLNRIRGTHTHTISVPILDNHGDVTIRINFCQNCKKVLSIFNVKEPLGESVD